MFCTSTLIEGVNLPADNLFITNYRSGRPQMTSVEFRNLIGRVGRIKFNLYGNVFFISDGEQVTEKEYVRLLREPIPDQRLSIVQELKPKLKKHVVETLLSGSSKIKPYDTKSQKQPEEEYIMMRKFGLILLKDIMDDRDSLVRREFAAFMPEGSEQTIREKFEGQKEFIDSDINISADQSRRLAAAIRNGTHYPKSQDGRFSHPVVLGFLEELSRIFNWDKYEFGTLGKRNKAGEHAKLSWYAVILSQWMEGHGLSYIMRKAIDYMKDNPEKFWLNDYGKSIELFLANGTADSLIIAELSNWNGKAIKIPRIEVADCKRDDINGAGVYFLFCKEEDDTDSVYIGESETVQDRLIQHIRDYNAEKEKFYWTTAVIFLGRDLNKALIRYLEDRFVQIARECKRYNVLTKNTYSRTVMKEAHIAAMEEFIDNVRVLINALGYKVLEPTVQNTSSSTQDDEILYLSTGAAKATGIVTTEGFVLLAGSVVNEKVSEKSLSKGAIALRKKHFNSGKVKDLTTTEDILFSSSSAAADFVTGYSVSGPAMWKNAVGKPLKEIESR